MFYRCRKLLAVVAYTIRSCLRPKPLSVFAITANGFKKREVVYVHQIFILIIVLLEKLSYICESTEKLVRFSLFYWRTVRLLTKLRNKLIYY